MIWEKPLGKRKDSKAVMMSPVRKIKDNGKGARMELETLKKYPDCEKFFRTLVGRDGQVKQLWCLEILR